MIRSAGIGLCLVLLFFSCDSRDAWVEVAPGLQKRLLGFDDQQRAIKDGIYAELGVHFKCFGEEGGWCSHTLELLPSQNLWMAESNFGQELLTMHAGDSVLFQTVLDAVEHPVFMPFVSRCACTTTENPILLLVAVREVFDSTRYAESPRNKRILLLEQEREEIERVLAQNQLTDLVTADWGGWHMILKEGEGHPPVQGEEIALAYTGRTLDGLIFDDASDSTQWLYFPYGKPDQVIRGIEIAVSTMLPGERRRVWLTSDLAFGARGSRGIVKPFAPVVFELERMPWAAKDTAVVK